VLFILGILKKIKLIPKWISEYFLFCSRRNKYRNDEDDFMIIGHRGSPVKECENTIRSFETAINDGANGLEIDLCITKDNKVLIWHDANPNEHKAILREAGFEPFVRHKPHPPAITNPYRKKISELTLQEVRDNFDYKERHHGNTINAHIPTLEEFFEWGVSKKKLKYLFLDIKVPDADAELSIPILNCISDLRKKYKPEFQIIIETSSKEMLDFMKKHNPDFNYVLDVEPPAGLILDPSEYSSVQSAIDNSVSHAIALRPRKITIANWTTYRRIIRYDLRLRIKHNEDNPDKQVKKIIGATVSKTRELKCLVKLGIGGIQTDFPERLLKIVEQHKKSRRVRTRAA
jgi:glycerophosphoryl diester phosphodiesterase